MTTTVTVYKSGRSLGTAEATNASASLTSYSGTAPHAGRNVQCVVTNSGAHDGLHWNTRVLVDGGTTLTIRDAFPYPTE